jgi:Flp pilus assembly pilin Flp
MNAIRGLGAWFGKLLPAGREDGQVLAEYAILVGLIAIVCVGVVTTLGVSVSGLFSQVMANWP